MSEYNCTSLFFWIDASRERGTSRVCSGRQSAFVDVDVAILRVGVGSNDADDACVFVRASDDTRTTRETRRKSGADDKDDDDDDEASLRSLCAQRVDGTSDDA